MKKTFNISFLSSEEFKQSQSSETIEKLSIQLPQRHFVFLKDPQTSHFYFDSSKGISYKEISELLKNTG